MTKINRESLKGKKGNGNTSRKGNLEAVGVYYYVYSFQRGAQGRGGRTGPIVSVMCDTCVN